MDDLSALSDWDLDRLLAGRGSVPAADPGLTGFLDEVRSTYTAPPSDLTRAQHLSAIASGQAPAEVALQTIESLPVTSERTRRSSTRSLTRTRLALVGAGLILALPLGATGLAAAGVALPEAVQTPFEELGVELPNQAPAGEVRGVIEATPPGERNCSFGRRIAKTASVRRAREDTRCEDAQNMKDQRSSKEGRGERHGSSRSRARGSQGAANPGANPQASQSPGSRSAAEAQQQAAPERQSSGEPPAQAPREPPPRQPQSGGEDRRPTIGDKPAQRRPPVDGRSTGETQSRMGNSIADGATDGRRP